MKSKSRITQANIYQAVEYTRKHGITNQNDYVSGYRALQELFDAKLNFESEMDVQIGAYAVYGWMPTIMKKIEPTKQERLRIFSLRFKNRVNFRDAFDEIANKVVDLTTINNSVVGTSKFLHFVAPNIFPIWDSRIASAFGLEHNYEVNNVAIYSKYCDAIQTHLKETIEWPTAFSMFDPVTDVRKLEFCLFQFGKYGRKEASSGR